MRGFLMSFLLLSTIVLASCNTNELSADAVDEASAENEKTDQSEKESSASATSQESVEDKTNTEAEYYLSHTKSQMDYIQSEMERLWLIRVRNQMPEKVYDEAWSTTLVDSMYILLDEYSELLTELQEVQTEDLGIYKDDVQSFENAISQSISYRVDVIEVLLEAGKTNGGIVSYMDDYNEALEMALVYEKEAKLIQESLERRLGI